MALAPARVLERETGKRTGGGCGSIVELMLELRALRFILSHAKGKNKNKKTRRSNQHTNG